MRLGGIFFAASRPRKALLDGLRVAAFWELAKKKEGYGNDCAYCARAPEMRAVLGCESEPAPDLAGFVQEYLVGGVTINRCPVALLSSPDTQEVLSLYGAYCKGITPHGAGLNHETALYCSTMRICASLAMEVEGMYAEEIERKAERSHV